MKTGLFGSEDYRDFLQQELSQIGRGALSQLAKSLHCQTSYVSRVLKGATDFSSEQALGTCEFLNFTTIEKKFFLLLVQRSRAGTDALRNFLTSEIENERRLNNTVSKRVEVPENLSEASQAIYYADLANTLVHAHQILLQNNSSAKASDLGLGPNKFKKVVDQLERLGVLEQKNGKLLPKAKKLHLTDESPYLPVYHANWRLKAIAQIHEELRAGVHYSSAIVISKKTALQIKEILVNTIQDIKAHTKQSAEEEIHAFCLDFFPIKR